MTNNDWLLKIAAFLYDPPEKAIAHGKRNEWSKAHFGTLTGQGRDAFLVSLGDTQGETYSEILKNAHRWAASSDRFSLADKLGKGQGSPNSIDVKFLNDPLVLHPLSAQSNPWVGPAVQQVLTNGPPNLDSSDPGQNAAFQAVEQCLRDIQASFHNEPCKQLLSLWRVLPDWLPQANRRIPALLWDHLPADTRTPDHTVRDAALATSAIITALPEPAFLLFSFGPIQRFIKTSRRTQDFWMGSLLLSWLSWQAIKTVAETYGPDCVLYPDLYRQPFVDWWLKNEARLDHATSFNTAWATSQEELGTSSFPTRFLAVLSKDAANEVASKAKERLEEEWMNLAREVKSKVEELCRKNDAIGTLSPNHTWNALWQQQALTSSPFDIRWVILPWEETGTKCLDTAKKWIELEEPVRHVYQTLRDTLHDDETNKNRFYPTHMYGALHELLARSHAARKRLQNFDQMAQEQGVKCSLCGERDALRPQERSFGEPLRVFWAKLAEHIPGHIAPDGEKLCAVCLTRRLAGKFYRQFKEKPPEGMFLDYHFTSTSGIAAAPFQAKLLDQNGPFRSAVEWFLIALRQLDKRLFQQLPGDSSSEDSNQWRFKAQAVPSVGKNAQASSAPWSDFVQVDGEWLFEEAYERHLVKYVQKLAQADELSSEEETRQKQQIAQAKDALKTLLDSAKNEGIPGPCPYFALLYFDGDEMGKWLSGAKAPRIGDILHPHSVRAILDAAAATGTNERVARSLYDTLKDLPRPMGPALHRAISRALRNFALEVARPVIEAQYRGRLVYAGGDELLALLPMEDALPAAWTLRQLWAGESFGKDGLVSLAGFLQKKDAQGQERLLTLMGGATASAAVVYGHYQFPMSLMIEAAYRSVEEQAKAVLGRDALALTIFKRSGETIETGARWCYGGLAVPDVLQDLRLAMDPYEAWDAKNRHQPEAGILSRRFAYQLRELADSLKPMGVDPQEVLEAQRTLLEQQLDRHAKPGHKEKDREDKAGQDKQHKDPLRPLKGKLRLLLEELALASNRPTEDKTLPFDRFLDLTMVAEFLAMRGGRT